MSPELEEKLYKDFPRLFQGRKNMPLEIAIHDGWFSIIYELSKKLEDIYNKFPENKRKAFESENSEQKFIFLQIKEKFGGLRAYFGTLDDEVDAAIAEAETKSFKTCEMCGQPGKAESVYGWSKTLCKAHTVDSRS